MADAIINESIEEWKDVIGYEGLYKISSLGRVIGSKFRNQRKLKPIPARGYHKIHLYVSPNESQRFYIHRLVALHFVENPKNLPIINHKNGIKSDNRTANLEWVTCSENSSHAHHALGKRTINRIPRPVIAYNDTESYFFHSMWQAVKTGFAASTSAIGSCLIGRTRSHNGYKWRDA